MKSLKVISLILIMTLLAACSIGSSDNGNEKTGFLAEMKEMDDKLGNDDEEEIDYDDTAENEVLIDLALEEFKTEWVFERDFSNTESSSLTIDDLRNATEIKIWHDKYIFIKINADDQNTLDRDDYERYYKFEEGELIDSRCEDRISQCSNGILTNEEMNFIKDEPDFKEESDNVLDLTKRYE